MDNKVLIVDNNQVILRLYSHYFQQKGYEVVTAEDGLAALQVLGSFQPSVIFVDMIMPNINGEKLCRIIRSMPQFDSTYIVIISAIAADNEIDFLSFRANACIAKVPFKEMQGHIATVMNHLKNGELERVSEKIFGTENIFERDITKELLAVKKHFEVTLENMVDSFLELTLEGNIIFTNSAAVKLFEMPEEELLSSFFPNLFPKEQKQLIAETLARLEVGTVEIGDDPPIVLHDKFLHIRFVQFCDHNQNFIIVLIQDVSKQKRSQLELIDHKEQLEDIVAQRTADYEKANGRLQDEIAERAAVQEKLEESVLQWRGTFDHISDFISVHDKDMKFVSVNKSLAGFLGKKPEELIGKQCYPLMHNTQEPLASCPHLQAIGNKKVCTEEIENVHLNKTLLVTCSPLFDRKGRLLGSVHVARDISEQKQMEVEREKLIGELQNALDEITTLRGILPVCSYCKNIRDDRGAWSQIEEYISAHSDATFSHSICPGCLKKHYPDYYESFKVKGEV